MRQLVQLEGRFRISGLLGTPTEICSSRRIASNTIRSKGKSSTANPLPGSLRTVVPRKASKTMIEWDSFSGSKLIALNSFDWTFEAEVYAVPQQIVNNSKENVESRAPTHRANAYRLIQNNSLRVLMLNPAIYVSILKFCDDEKSQARWHLTRIRPRINIAELEWRFIHKVSVHDQSDIVVEEKFLLKRV